MSCGIYKITNLVNNKVYIGQSTDIERRWRNHRARYTTCNSILYQAIRKYGLENFSFEIVEECGENFLNEREKYWVSYYNSFEEGYNATIGGNGQPKYDYSSIYSLWERGFSEKKICEQLGASEYTVKTALNIYGVSSEQIIVRGQGKRVQQITMNGDIIATYDSANEAGRAMNRPNGGINIARCCNNKIRAVYGFFWKWEEDVFDEDFVQTRKPKTTGKPVLQYTLDNTFIKEYESCAQANRELGKVGSTGIAKCARGERPTAYGYIWKYKD